jgi:ribosomal protein S17E
MQCVVSSSKQMRASVAGYLNEIFTRTSFQTLYISDELGLQQTDESI